MANQASWPCDGQPDGQPSGQPGGQLCD